MNKVKRLAIDSMILIYLLEANENFSKPIRRQLEQAEELILSSLGLGEILAGFEKKADTEGKLKFLSFIESYKKLSVVGFGKQEALIFAKLRAAYPSIKPPDAIHLATAISGRADAFFTHDKKLQKVEEVFILALER